MKQTDTNSIRYPQEVDEKLEKLAKGFGRSKKELFCQMVDYFYRCKKDPGDPGDEVLKKELSSGINRILAFIRQQEKDFLLPMFTNSNELKTMTLRQGGMLQSIGKLLLGGNEHTKVLVDHSSKMLMELKQIASRQLDKETLKEYFSEVLEFYITQREEMGWTTSGTKKEELIAHVRKLVKNL